MNGKGILRFILLMIFGLLAGGGALLAETVYLNTGESIRGRIVRIEEDALSIESERGFGVIQIQRQDIVLIEFDEGERDFSRLFGIGYYHQAVPPGTVNQSLEYGLDAVSLKMWLSQTSSVDFLLGFYSAQSGASSEYTVLSVDIRYASVFDCRGHLDLYWGASGGFLNVKDTTTSPNVEETGMRMTAFLGVEMFFSSMPNLGIASEIGIRSVTLGDNSIINLSMTTFPTFSVRYYF